MKVEDDLTGMIVFCVLMAVLGFLFHGMFYRLDAVSYTEQRRAIFDALAVPREERRHRTGFQSPWDSYQFGLGTGLILMTMLMFGVCMPAMQQNGRVVPAIVGITFVLLWVALFAIESYDPSVPSEERDAQREEATVEESERALATYCKMDGCRCWYHRPYRKHCSMCNKCTTGFDHHCPFLNQCICDANYKLFFTILVLVNLVCLLAIGCGIWLITEAWRDPDHSAVAKEAKRIWGTAMFSLLAATMVLLALGHLPFVLPLLNYHIYLCRLQRETGLFQATYMFTTDRDGYLRGRGAYLDQRAKDHLMWLTKFLFMDLQAGFEIWSEHVRHKTHLRDSQSVVDGLSSLTKA